MESSANIHHQQHQLQDQYVVVGNSSALVIPSCYAAGSTHAWTPSSSTILNTGSFINACSNVGTLSSRDSWQQNNNMVLSSLDSSSMTQDLGFHWANNTAGNHITAQPTGYDLHLARVKNESSDSSCTKVNEVLSSSSQSIEDIHTASYMKINERRDLKDLNAKLLLRNFPSGYQQMNGFQLSSEDSNSSLSSSGSVTMPNRSGSFNQQIFPTLNDLNSFNQMTLANSTTLDMNNSQSLNLFNSARFNEGLSQLSRDHQHSFLKGGFSNYGLDNMHQPSIRPLTSPNHISSSFSNGVAEAKRSSIMLEPKAPQPAPKKSRIESRSSCPPFNVMKVRKEKLGDRIAALQQLVAPFGKTDTASVLMEAIGYIKFLQNQVEEPYEMKVAYTTDPTYGTLSVPYMKSSRSKTRMMQGGSAGYESEESKRDLRSRGLCLVPVSCLSYVTDGGGGVWPPPNFGGGF